MKFLINSSNKRSIIGGGGVGILIFGLFAGFAQGSPLYDVYRVDNEPEPIPMQYLKVPLQIELPRNEVLDMEREIPNGIYKRTRHSGGSNIPDSCCPTVLDVIQPTYGKNRSGDLVELYQSETVRQRFYENSCAPTVADQPCRFLERKHSSQSRCVQQYSYSYAMVRDFGSSNSEWKLDYIQIRSGCSCHISH